MKENIEINRLLYLQDYMSVGCFISAINSSCIPNSLTRYWKDGVWIVVIQVNCNIKIGARTTILRYATTKRHIQIKIE